MKWFQQNRTVHSVIFTFRLAFSFSKLICDQSWLTYPVARNTNTDNNTQNDRYQILWKVEVKKNGLLLSFVNASLEIF